MEQSRGKEAQKQTKGMKACPSMRPEKMCVIKSLHFIMHEQHLKSIKPGVPSGSKYYITVLKSLIA